MTVVLDVRFDPDTGVGRYVNELRRALERSRRHRYIFLDRATRSDVVTVRSTAFSIGGQFELPLRLARARPAILHVPHFLIPMLWPGRVVVTVQDVIPLDFPDTISSGIRRWYPALLKIACRRAAHIIVPSEATREALLERKLVESDRVTVTPYAAPMILEGTGPSPVAGPYVLAVALLRSHKNLAVLVRAFAAVAQHHPDLKLVIAGEGPERARLEGLSADLAVSDRVLLLGRIPDTAVAALYRHASVFVAPSLAEGFGLTILEAMACGVPVVTSTAKALVETARGASLSFDPADPSALSGLLDRIIGDESLRADLRARGRARVRVLSWERMAEETERVYDAVLSR